jgi:hypothetical protein
MSYKKHCKKCIYHQKEMDEHGELSNYICEKSNVFILRNINGVVKCSEYKEK